MPDKDNTAESPNKEATEQFGNSTATNTIFEWTTQDQVFLSVIGFGILILFAVSEFRYIEFWITIVKVLGEQNA